MQCKSLWISINVNAQVLQARVALKIQIRLKLDEVVVVLMRRLGYLCEIGVLLLCVCSINRFECVVCAVVWLILAVYHLLNSITSHQRVLCNSDNKSHIVHTDSDAHRNRFMLLKITCSPYRRPMACALSLD